jgi:hypothetical protein
MGNFKKSRFFGDTHFYNTFSFLGSVVDSITSVKIVNLERAFTISILAVRVGLKDSLPDVNPDLFNRVIDAGHPVQWSCPHILKSDQDTLKLSSDTNLVL